MKRKEEKRRKLHEGLLKMLYPSPSSPSHQRESSEEADENTHSEGLDLDLVPDEYENERSSSSSASDDHEGGCEPQKLTRAQRKRIRRKKMKEAASRRQNIIGPLLANASDVGAEIADEYPPGVRQNAQTPEAAWDTKQNKVKQRRMAKKLGGESSTLSGMAGSDAGSGPFNNESSKES
ncbi:PREDICTED: uncharacterized protein LOC109177932 isoform X2 [Ipomoea nil]|uniref:uncharacterized protein LOC109177932 isoform X2 n=1 Tax=Ipomoea nil TaxID=35883 RepID=UPI0009011D4B|nr:PREDICTED: uncharacterized protein LOC109177932 isoform X2 [Ipomoea nil]